MCILNKQVKGQNVQSPNNELIVKQLEEDRVEESIELDGVSFRTTEMRAQSAWGCILRDGHNSYISDN